MFKLPATRREFWASKIATNRQRDAQVLERLAASGWRSFILWECSLRGPARRPLDQVLDQVTEWLHVNQGNNSD
jgi:DNA mismatch endonuclease (patch repair protein)